MSGYINPISRLCQRFNSNRARLDFRWAFLGVQKFQNGKTRWDPEFTCTIFIDGDECCSRTGRTKKEAKRAAAIECLKFLNTQPRKTSKNEFDKSDIALFVDLGNVHDIVPYYSSRNPGFPIFAYADLAFNGAGVREEPPEWIQVWQSQVSHRNAADIKLVWDVATLCQEKKMEPLHVVIATKDQGFRSLESLVQTWHMQHSNIPNTPQGSSFHRCSFIQGLPGLMKILG